MSLVMSIQERIAQLKALFLSFVPSQFRDTSDNKQIVDFVKRLQVKDPEFNNPSIQAYFTASPVDHIVNHAMLNSDTLPFFLLGYKLFSSYNFINASPKVSDVGYVVSVTNFGSKDSLIANSLLKLCVEKGISVNGYEGYFFRDPDESIVVNATTGLQGGVNITSDTGNLLGYDISEDIEGNFGEAGFNSENSQSARVVVWDDELNDDYRETSNQQFKTQSELGAFGFDKVLSTAELETWQSLRSDLGLDPLTEDEKKDYLESDRDEANAAMVESTKIAQDKLFSELKEEKWRQYPFEHPCFNTPINLYQLIQLIGELTVINEKQKTFLQLNPIL